MPDFSLGLSNLFGKFSKDEKQPERRTSGGGQSGSRAYSDRTPTPKPIGGPLTGLGEAATSTAETVVGGFTKPVGDLTKDVLPLAAIAAAVLLLRK